MVRILFVDDDSDSRQMLQQTLEVMRAEWEMDFAASGPEALGLIKERPYDAVVTDQLSAPTTGLELLARFMELHPGGIRFLLSGGTTREDSVRLAGAVHQFLLKPCELNELRDAVTRAVTLRDFLSNPRLQGIVSKMQALPSIPAVYLDLVDELRSDDPSPETIGRIISQDMGMCMKMLQLVNSAFFGLPQQVTKPEEAVMYLGLDTVHALVLSLQIFSLFGRESGEEEAIDQLWKHSWRTGKIARRICTLEFPGRPELADPAMTCGLLHDIGKLVLRTGAKSQYRDALALREEKQMVLWQAEQEVFGSSHAEVGAYLIGLWGLPASVVEAVAFHHQPSGGPHTFSLVTATHAANALDHELSPPNGSSQAMDLEYLKALGLEDRPSDWKLAVVGASRSTNR